MSLVSFTNQFHSFLEAQSIEENPPLEKAKAKAEDIIAKIGSEQISSRKSLSVMRKVSACFKNFPLLRKDIQQIIRNEIEKMEGEALKRPPTKTTQEEPPLKRMKRDEKERRAETFTGFKEIATMHNLFSEEALKDAINPDRNLSPVQVDRYARLAQLKAEWTPTTVSPDWASGAMDFWNLSEDYLFQQLKKNFSDHVAKFLETDHLFNTISHEDKELILQNASEYCDKLRLQLLARAEIEIDTYKKFINSLKGRGVDLVYELKAFCDHVGEELNTPKRPNDYSRFVKSKVQKSLLELLYPGDTLSEFCGKDLRKNKIPKYRELTTLVHSAAAHMAYGPLAGNIYTNALSYMRDLLKKDSPPLSPEFIEAFDFATQIGRSIDEATKDTIPSISRMIEQKVKELKLGQSMLVPVGIMTHAMVLFITCTKPEEASQKKYRAILYNTGPGLETYHHYRISETGKKECQQGLVFEDVPEASLDCNLFQGLLNLTPMKERNIATFYTTLFEKLSGTIQPPSTDERLWGKQQVGGSCTMKCLVALLKGATSEQVYASLKEHRRFELIRKAIEKIKSQDAGSTVLKIVALEVAKKLALAIPKHILDPIEATKKMKDIHQFRSLLETHIPSAKASALFDKLYAHTTLTPNLEVGFFPKEKILPEQAILRQIFSLINDTLPTAEKRQEALQLMSTLLTKIKTEKPASQSITEYAITALEIGEMIRHTPLTVEQISLLTAFTALVLNRLQQILPADLSPPETSATGRLEIQIPDLLDRYNHTKKPDDLKDAPDLLAEIAQLNPPLPPSPPTAPPKLRKQIDKK